MRITCQYIFFCLLTITLFFGFYGSFSSCFQCFFVAKRLKNVNVCSRNDGSRRDSCIRSYEFKSEYITSIADGDWSNSAELSKTRVNFKNLIETCRRTGVYTPAVTAAYKWLNSDKERLTPTGLTSIIQIFGLAGLIDDAMDSLDIAKSRGLRLNSVHFNVCINACKVHKRYDDALKTFARMKEENVRPDLKTFSVMIQVLGQLGEWEQALGLFSAIPIQDRDAKLFTSMLSALEKSKKSDQAMVIWREMKKFSPNMCTSQALNAVISCLGKDNKVEEAVAMYEEEELYADRMALYTITGILNKVGKVEKSNALKLSFVQRTNNCKDWACEDVDDSLSNSFELVSKYVGKINFVDLIREAKRSGDYRQAIKAADTWLTTQRKFPPSGVASCINIYGLANMPYKLYNILKMVEHGHLRLNSKQMNAFMAALNRCGQASKSIEVFLKMQEDGVVHRGGELEQKIKNVLPQELSKDDKEFRNMLHNICFDAHRDEFSYGVSVDI